MKAEDVVARARECVAQGCHYRLGKGGMNPNGAVPWTGAMECDCSGFALWCQALPREDETGKWWDTTAIAHDALNDAKRFVQIEPEFARPGDCLVYGDKGGMQGHIGVIATIEQGPKTVIHCSHGNDVRTGDAIRETTPQVFALNGAIIVRSTALDPPVPVT